MSGPVRVIGEMLRDRGLLDLAASYEAIAAEVAAEDRCPFCYGPPAFNRGAFRHARGCELLDLQHERVLRARRVVVPPFIDST